ncbi:unnamed protein product [Candidula unifasciata]|uniref:H15 domain-containing protein n=1 Tax=Candidula unifasciata TaxID=100452 RepID=A0A8S3ZNT2_9EUPU|nr:unnamed protein product [Candidula unifasciata]
MYDAATVAPAAAAAPAKAAKKKVASSKPKTAVAHLNYKAMIADEVSALKERGGSSRQAILKYIIANYKVGDNPTAINARLKAALKAGVTAGSLKQSKGNWSCRFSFPSLNSVVFRGLKPTRDNLQGSACP